jgi:tRNA threonylcarbamoyladenosine biosynthesis protein TsaE
MTLSKHPPADPFHVITGSASIHLPGPDATAELGARLSRYLRPGDTILLDGPIGAGKSHMARALISALLAEEGRREDIPSPTFTLVQTYETARGQVFHTALYRLTDPEDVMELGLDTAFEDAMCLVEWPDRLGPDTPTNALRICIATEGEGRIATLEGGARWQSPIAQLTREMAS